MEASLTQTTKATPSLHQTLAMHAGVSFLRGATAGLLAFLAAAARLGVPARGQELVSTGTLTFTTTYYYGSGCT